MSVEHVEVRHGVYHDSVSLMTVSRALTERADVDTALVAMATELNTDLAADLGFDLSRHEPGPTDLLVALRLADGADVDAVRAAVDAELAARQRAPAGDGAAGPTEAPPRTVTAAARRQPADLVLVSVPGEHAAVEAADGLAAGLHVMVFSDNVPIEQEVALKELAAARGLLLMGPDCGTAIVGGVALGFANVTRPGPVGLIGASGTGLQQVCCLLDDAGVGVRHALGVGGRDLSQDVGARATLTALAALDADPGTELIVVISKPPDEAVAARVRGAAEAAATPVVLGFVGPGAGDLTEVTADALARLGVDAAEPAAWPAQEPSPGGALRGLFSGGTLCDEAMVIAADALGPIRSNVPLQPGWELAGSPAGDVMVDLGEDEYTRGRPHPMVDHSLRREHLARAAADAEVGVILLDVVLGHAAHPDPAAELGPAIAEARERAGADGRSLAVVVSLCGTVDDPQDRQRQIDRLREAGASVLLSNAAAARHAVALTGRAKP